MHGFDSRAFAGGSDGAEALAGQGLAPGYFLFVGRVSPRKDLRLVVEVAARLKAEGKLPQVVLVGPGDEPSGVVMGDEDPQSAA